MRLGGSTAPHAAVVGVGGLAGLSFGGGKYRRACAWLPSCRVRCVQLQRALLLALAAQLCLALHPPTMPAHRSAATRPLCCRCPGRYFAEAELALVAATLLLVYDLRLLPPQAAEPAGTRAAAAAAALDAAGVPGDPSGLLPPPDLRRLVGIKVPAGPCWVQFERRR